MSRQSSLTNVLSATYIEQAIQFLVREYGYERRHARAAFMHMVKASSKKRITDMHCMYNATLKMTLEEFTDFIQGKHMLGHSNGVATVPQSQPKSKETTAMPKQSTANKTIATTATAKVHVEIKPEKMRDLKAAVCRRMGIEYTDSKQFRADWLRMYGDKAFSLAGVKLNSTESWSKMYDFQTNAKRVDEGKVTPPTVDVKAEVVDEPKPQPKRKGKKQPTKAEMIDAVLDELRKKLENCTKSEVAEFAAVLAMHLNK